MDTYVIGDIHGKFYLLVELMAKIKPEKDDTLIFLGDYIDRGDMSFEVVEFLLELNKRHNCVFLMGNHEDMFMDFLSGINENLFKMNGGYKTVNNYETHGYDIHMHTPYIERTLPRDHIDFFQNLKLYHETDDYIFVHAGLLPGVPLEKQPREELLWIRYRFIGSDYDWGKKVVFGHTPSNDVLIEANKICIDTGAAYDGPLTAIKLPEELIIQQLPKQDDKPNGVPGYIFD